MISTVDRDWTGSTSTADYSNWGTDNIRYKSTSELLQEKIDRVSSNRLRIPEQFLDFEHIGWKYAGTAGRMANGKLEDSISRYHALVDGCARNGHLKKRVRRGLSCAEW